MLSFYSLPPPVPYLQVSYNLQSSMFSETEKLIRKLVSLLLRLEPYGCEFDKMSQEIQADAVFYMCLFLHRSDPVMSSACSSRRR